VKASPGRTNGFSRTMSNERRQSHDPTWIGTLLSVDYAPVAMKFKLRLLVASSLALFFAAPTAPRVLAQNDVVRKPLLDAHLSPEKTVTTVEIKEVTIPPHSKTPLHLHPIPVVGVIDEGVIAFQIEGQPLQHLRPGDAYFEPANTHILHFDNESDTPARFSAFYLFGKDEHELIRFLKQ